MSTKRKIAPRIIAILTVLASVVIGVALGLGLASTKNIINQENFTKFNPALPTRLLDIHRDVITEFASDEKREMISFDKLPPHLVNALITREDQIFFDHNGFSLKGIIRAVIGQVFGKNLGGGSTITQQIAGTLYCDRSDMRITRKIKELWWALQIERRYTKNEIIELYLNEVFFGEGTYGIEAAAKYYFGHSAQEVTPAEAALLVIQLSNPAGNNPFKHPDSARLRQTDVLNQMTEQGYLTKKEANNSFDEYWQNFDYTRVSSSAYFMRDDKAPWFSEYVRRQLSDMLYGTLDYTKDGFTVNTTLDLKHQAYADEYVARGLKYGIETFQATRSNKFYEADTTYIPMVEMLGLVFNIDSLSVSDSRAQYKVMSDFRNDVNPVLEVMSLVCGIDPIKTITSRTNVSQKSETEKSTVECAFVSLENETGYITALVGGSKYGVDNQVIRATQATVQPGSTFKPLYYSAAIDSRKFTAATQLMDAPVVFKKTEGDTPYIPNNYGGTWKGSILLWKALATSLNIPALHVLDGIGFDAAINRSAALLGIKDRATIEKTFPRVYSLGLGVISVSPLQMCRAFAVFANQGREVEPIAIRSVETRTGSTLLDPERDLRIDQKNRKGSIQVVSPQNAYIMTDLLKGTLTVGTLASSTQRGKKFIYTTDDGREYSIPMSGKTGTTQNWADAWGVISSPYYTATAWFGFDRPGNSLGPRLSGAALAGPVVSDFMRDVHKNLPYKDFVKPQTGLVRATVCSVSGELMTDYCTAGATTQYFLAGTQPQTSCHYHEKAQEAKSMSIDRLQRSNLGTILPKEEYESDTSEIELPDFLKDLNKPNKKQTNKKDDDFGDFFDLTNDEFTPQGNPIDDTIPIDNPGSPDDVAPQEEQPDNSSEATTGNTNETTSDTTPDTTATSSPVSSGTLTTVPATSEDTPEENPFL